MKLFSIIVLLVCSISIRAQVKHNIVRTYNYYREVIPGVSMADDAGNMIERQRDTTYFIYGEFKGFDKPLIDSVYIGNKVFIVDVLSVTALPAIPGRRKDNDLFIKHRPRQGNSLWLLELTFVSNKTSKYRLPTMTGKKRGKRFYYTASTFIELHPVERG